ncbi:MAG: hypothetical protein ACLQQ4_01430 [Bacteroidia bacterium]
MKVLRLNIKSIVNWLISKWDSAIDAISSNVITLSFSNYIRKELGEYDGLENQFN